MTIRVLLADDHAVLRHGLRMVLETEPDLNVVGEVDDGALVSAAVETHRPDVLVLDLSLPNRSGQDIIRQMGAQSDAPAIVVLTMYPEDSLALHLLQLGAAAYLSKSRPPDQVVAAIRKVARGGRFVTSELAELALQAKDTGASMPHFRLSARESQVFVLLLEGQTVSEVAAELELSGSTVSNHVASIKDKLGVTSMVEVFRYAHRVGLLGDPG